MTRCLLVPRVFAAAGIAIGLLSAPGAGCRAECPDTTPADEYGFGESAAEFSDAWIVESGRVEVSDTQLRITYDTVDGSSWEVVYHRIDAP